MSSDFANEDWFGLMYFMYLLWYKHAIQSELLNYSESYESVLKVNTLKHIYLKWVFIFYFSIIDSFILPLYMHNWSYGLFHIWGMK